MPVLRWTPPTEEVLILRWVNDTRASRDEVKSIIDDDESVTFLKGIVAVLRQVALDEGGEAVGRGEPVYVMPGEYLVVDPHEFPKVFSATHNQVAKKYPGCGVDFDPDER